MSLSAIAALALQVGPSVIRGISSALGGSDVAEKVADVVDKVDALTNKDPEFKRQAIESELDKFSFEELQELNHLKVELEREITRRQEIAAQDRQAEHAVTASLVQSGDSASDRFVRLTRPLMALISCSSACYYVISDPNPDLTIAGFLIGLGATYMGLRHREKDKGLTS